MTREISAGGVVVRRAKDGWEMAVIEPRKEPAEPAASDKKKARKVTLALPKGLVDAGEKPAVPAAILKYHATEYARQIANDAMDVHGGKGIMLGPNNYLGRFYQSVPIAITVEGANILTRNLIIFGQGAIRCHPYVLKEM